MRAQSYFVARFLLVSHSVITVSRSFKAVRKAVSIKCKHRKTASIAVQVYARTRDGHFYDAYHCEAITTMVYIQWHAEKWMKYWNTMNDCGMWWNWQQNKKTRFFYARASSGRTAELFHCITLYVTRGNKKKNCFLLLQISNEWQTIWFPTMPVLRIGFPSDWIVQRCRRNRNRWCEEWSASIASDNFK